VIFDLRQTQALVVACALSVGCGAGRTAEWAKNGIALRGVEVLAWSRQLATDAAKPREVRRARDSDAGPPPPVPTGPVGSVIVVPRAAVHGNARAYIHDLYLGTLERGATVELLDAHPQRDEFKNRIIKVRVIGDEGGLVGRTVWIGLRDTSFVDDLDPQSETVTPARPASSAAPR